MKGLLFVNYPNYIWSVGHVRNCWGIIRLLIISPLLE